jgi:hypothetical protein
MRETPPDFDFALDLGDGLELDVVQSRRDPLEFWKQVAYEGEFVKGDRRVRISKSLMDHWHDTFAEMSAEGVQVPVPIEHTKDPERRRGTIKAFRRQLDSKGRDSLFARFAFRDEEAAKLAKTAGVSVYVPRQAQSSRTGRTWQNPVEHVAITDYPVIADMEPFQAIVLSRLDADAMAWDEDQHPRHEAGSSEGGRFAPKHDPQGDPASSGHPSQQPSPQRDAASADALRTERLEQALTDAGPSPGPEASEYLARLTQASKEQDVLEVMGAYMGGNKRGLPTLPPAQRAQVIRWAKAAMKHLTGDASLLKPPNKPRPFRRTAASYRTQPPERTLRNPVNFSYGDDDMTLKDLAQQCQIDPNLPDDQIVMALSKVIAQLKGPAQTGAQPPRPQPGMQPGMQPGVYPQQPRPFGMSQDDEPLALSGSLLETVREGRAIKLQRAAERGLLTPAGLKQMQDQYLTDEAVQFSHVDGFDDGFDGALRLLEANGPVVSMRGRTGVQSLSGGDRVVALSKGGDAAGRDYLGEAVQRRVDAAKRAAPAR